MKRSLALVLALAIAVPLTAQRNKEPELPRLVENIDVRVINVDVVVTDRRGNPVTGLTAKNFAVDPMIVGPGGALVDITSAVPVRLPGTYIINVVPIRTETWKSGGYVFAVAVTQGANRGQALTTVLLD